MGPFKGPSMRWKGCLMQYFTPWVLFCMYKSTAKYCENNTKNIFLEYNISKIRLFPYNFIIFLKKSIAFRKTPMI